MKTQYEILRYLTQYGPMQIYTMRLVNAALKLREQGIVRISRPDLYQYRVELCSPDDILTVSM